uniref:Uncharacterized protein n=1 Tax=Rhizophora mucronata TaxID=61149 RepID=A0A2P2PXU6_RHIMU
MMMNTATSRIWQENNEEDLAIVSTIAGLSSLGAPCSLPSMYCPAYKFPGTIN